MSCAIRVFSALLLSFAACGFTLVAQAQAFPSRLIKIVVTFPQGGAPDILSRLFGAKMEDT
jgi:tripartite-type tricarboxylate transporter receptor subunit TctC